MDKLNIVEILKLNNYELVEQEQNYKILRIKFTEQELQEKLKEKHLYDYDLKGIFEVEIAEVGFNGYGDLYIILESTGNDGHFKTGDTFEVIEK